MLLIIPAIDIKGGKCVQPIHGHEGFTYSDDPTEMAKLWRKENAKSLYVTDIDGIREGRLMNFEVIDRMVKSVDIPVTLGGGIHTLEEVQRAFDAGIYRVMVRTVLIEDPDEAKRILDKFSASKVSLGIDAENGIVISPLDMQSTGVTAVSLGLNAKELGFRRIIYSDVAIQGTGRGPNFTAIRRLGEKTGLKITAASGVTGLSDLLRLQELEPYGIDSVVIGRALHSNNFACQGLWRLCEAGNFPYTARV